MLVEDASDAELRFANNTTTTNGVRRSRSVTVVSIAEVDGGVAAGSATRSGPVDVADLVRAAQAAAAAAPAAEDASPLLDGTSDRAFGEPAAETDLSVLSTVLGSLPAAFDRAARSGTVLAGFVEHGVVTTSLGTSTGIRRRHVQPTGSLELTGRADGGARSAWAKVATPGFVGVTLEQLEEDLARRLAWATRRVDLPAGRYEVVLPPGAVAEFMADLYGYAGAGQDAEDGTTVFSKPGGGTRVGDRLSELAFELRSDPTAAGIECIPFLATGASSASTSVFDNGLELEPTRWIADGRLAALMYHRAGAKRSGVAAQGPIDNLVLELPGCDRVGRGPGREHGAGAASQLAVLHPHGRPHDAAAHRAHARRRVPRGGREGGGGRQQLQVQREPGRPPREGDAGGGVGPHDRARGGRVPQPDDRAAFADP